MMRPGTNVKRPAITSAPRYSPIMVERWRDTAWRVRGPEPERQHHQREDRQQVDGAPRPPEPDLMHPERADGDDQHQGRPGVAERAMACGALDARQLHGAQHEGAQSRHRHAAGSAGARRQGEGPWRSPDVNSIHIEVVGPSASASRDRRAPLPGHVLDSADWRLPRTGSRRRRACRSSCRRARWRAWRRCRCLRRRVAGLIVLVHAGAGTRSGAAAGIEHGEHAVEALQHDLGGVAVLAVLALPLARLQRPLDVQLGALLHVLLHHPAEALVEDDDRVPLGLLLALARGLVAPALGGGDAQIGDGAAILRAADLRVLAHVADQDHFVDGTGHAGLLSLCRARRQTNLDRDVSRWLWPARGLRVACPRFCSPQPARRPCSLYVLK